MLMYDVQCIMYYVLMIKESYKSLKAVLLFPANRLLIVFTNNISFKRQTLNITSKTACFKPKKNL